MWRTGSGAPLRTLPRGNIGASRHAAPRRDQDFAREFLSRCVKPTSVVISASFHGVPNASRHALCFKSLSLSQNCETAGHEANNTRQMCLRHEGNAAMKTIVNRLWAEQTGAIVSAEIMLVGTILVLGVIVGLKSVRDSVVTELADVGQAIANVNQSYCYSGTSGHAASSGGGHYQDQSDFCDTNGGGDNCPTAKCVNVAAWTGSES